VNAAIDEQTTQAEVPGSRSRHRQRRKAILTVAIVIALGAGGIAGELLYPLGHRPAASGVQDNGAATATGAVSRRSLSSQRSVAGTLGYAGSYTILGQGGGTITWLPSAGQVIRQGQELYGVSNSPVILLYGSIPAYRTLAEGKTAANVTGADVRQLNRDLVTLGYASRADLDPNSDEFTWATKAAIEKLQQHFGLKQSGELSVGQIVFLPTPARVTDVTATLGGQAGGPVFKATSTTQQVSVNLDASLQSQVKAGDRVMITLPDGQVTPGVVTSVGTVATSGSGSGSGSSSTATVPVAISPLRMSPSGHLDQASVQVAITADTVRDALVVPVNALLALASGGFAVEVVGANGKHVLVPVTTGLFDDSDGLVQVTGNLTPGQRVVVPSS
jgi:multidrug efflux pump subunit AcrA (membrane-fusion protein)